jgi:hypothetical protein
MPTLACQYFYDCNGCQAVLRPKAGDCCVFCSYSDVICPPKQNGACCPTPHETFRRGPGASARPHWLGHNSSVAVWVGYIAFYGVAVQTGGVIVVYLRQALDRRIQLGGALTASDIHEATVASSVLRLRRKPMTVSAGPIS